MPEKIRAIVVRVGQPGKVEMIDNNLQTLQGIVGGYIEAAAVLRDHVVLICNEEGKLKGLPPNRHVAGVDTIVGDFLILRYDAEGENIDLTDDDIQFLVPFLLP